LTIQPIEEIDVQLPELQPAFQLPKQLLASMPQNYPDAYGKPTTKAMKKNETSARGRRTKTPARLAGRRPAKASKSSAR
jgi:hypothetical protein